MRDRLIDDRETSEVAEGDAGLTWAGEGDASATAH